MTTPTNHRVIVRCENIRQSLKTHFIGDLRRGTEVPAGWRKDNVNRDRLLAKARAATAKVPAQAKALGEAVRLLDLFDLACKKDIENCEFHLKGAAKLESRLAEFGERFTPSRNSVMLPTPADVKEGDALAKEYEDFLKAAQTSLGRSRQSAVACFKDLMATSGAKLVEWGKLGKIT